MARTKASAKKSTGGKSPKTKVAKKKTGALLLKKAPFGRLVREVTKTMKTDAKFKPSALAAVQEAAEAFATGTLEGAVMLQLHRKRKTLVKKDVEYVRRIKGELLDA